MTTPEELADSVAWQLDNMALAGAPAAWDRFERALRTAKTVQGEKFTQSAAAQEALDGLGWEIGVTVPGSASDGRMIIQVTTRPRTQDTSDVFVHWANDDPIHVGTITREGRHDWVAHGLVYGTKAGAAHDVARRAVAAGRTPYQHDYAKMSYR